MKGFSPGLRSNPGLGYKVTVLLMSCISSLENINLKVLQTEFNPIYWYIATIYMHENRAKS